MELTSKLTSLLVSGYCYLPLKKQANSKKLFYENNQQKIIPEKDKRKNLDFHLS
jgi:hypothetical protein